MPETKNTTPKKVRITPAETILPTHAKPMKLNAAYKYSHRNLTNQPTRQRMMAMISPITRKMLPVNQRTILSPEGLIMPKKIINPRTSMLNKK
jgi:hypothetical protein